MPTILLSDHTYLLMVRTNINPLSDQAVKLPDGWWDVPIAEDTLERLDALSYHGETHEDAVSRLLYHALHPQVQ